jgi:hypothetical protein
MGSSYDTSDLHRRQHDGDVGNAVLGSTGRATSQRRRALLPPLALTALGVLLALWGPLPGLGLVLTIGGVMGLAMTAMILLTGGYS